MRVVKCTCTTEKTNYTTDTDLQKVKKQKQGMGLTVAFARDLAKRAPLSLYFLMRVAASGGGASLQ